MNCDKHENELVEWRPDVNRKGGKHERGKLINGEHIRMDAWKRGCMKAQMI